MTVCYFLVGQIAQHCNASVTSASGSGDFVSLYSKDWGDEVIIWADKKSIDHPVTMPEKDLLILLGAALIAGYKTSEYMDDQFRDSINSNKGNE